LALSYAGAAGAQAGALADPTRPPIPVAESAAGEPAARTGPELQSVLISQSRRIAVISGTPVALGGKFGKATVASITETAVQLRYADRQETLHLMPGVIKRERRADDAVQSDKGNSK
jgi:MSHA biogenesis protein MshK